jgi:hypothetical protein
MKAVKTKGYHRLPSRNLHKGVGTTHVQTHEMISCKV